MRILFVHPVTRTSIGDVARGYRNALERAGHEIADYSIEKRTAYHKRAIPEEHSNPFVVAKHACECIVVEAMYHRAELVFIVSGLNTHPCALWLLAQVQIPVAVVFTESPYDDDQQADWLTGGERSTTTVFTNDRFSAKERGWRWSAPCFDPAIHRPVPPEPEYACDVFMVGSGWIERQRFLEAVNWEGINLRLYGIWPDLGNESPLYRHYRPMMVNNERIAAMYCSAKININFHRAHPEALTPNPRVYEIAACGAFQLSDRRADMDSVFGTDVPTFETPTHLEQLIRFYLKRDGDRNTHARRALEAVRNQTFDHRVAAMVDILEPQPAAV